MKKLLKYLGITLLVGLTIGGAAHKMGWVTVPDSIKDPGLSWCFWCCSHDEKEAAPEPPQDPGGPSVPNSDPPTPPE